MTTRYVDSKGRQVIVSGDRPKANKEKPSTAITSHDLTPDRKLRKPAPEGKDKR